MLCSPPGPSSWKPWPSLGLLRARPAEQRLNLPHPNQPTPPHPKNPKGELVDQMGTGPTNPSPRELSLSNQTRFKSGKKAPIQADVAPTRKLSLNERAPAIARRRTIQGHS